MIHIGSRIKELRIQRNISAKELALALDVSQSFISAIENGNKKCSLENIDKICSVLGITLSDFFATNDNQLPPDLIQLMEALKKLPSEERRALNHYLQTRLKG
ncbi:helix-turn-helix domain-containing protein [Thermoflavimicrobium daqui]|uniref:HTH cro/C1-type domain-containing protein n=1 Tax=Thermoflavimicrobium daqui TaxID=2137476 RepID=A0A364K936_9BACL|nr:helix-turn-helix transcriptional regulator [Thermoflavimicrobium daqui]RAL26732.1 hypothetical protein DL897_01385 [Thermoflavimicrobium daqui]